MEKPYAPPANPHKIIKSIEWLDEEIVDAMTKQYVLENTNQERQVPAFSSCAKNHIFFCSPFFSFRFLSFLLYAFGAI